MFDLGFIVDLVLVFDVGVGLGIGSWSFFDDLVVVVDYGNVFVGGLLVGGLILVVKYFFGYGCVNVDSYDMFLVILLLDDF